MVETARFFMEFTQKESCGKCVPCREGTKRMLEILDRIIDNKGTLRIWICWRNWRTPSARPPCAAGTERLQACPEHAEVFPGRVSGPRGGPPLSICNKEKPHPTIDPDKCKGCGKCRKNCPMEAITGAPKKVHVIDPEKCINCGACVSNCPFGAIAAASEEGKPMAKGIMYIDGQRVPFDGEKKSWL